MFLIIQIPCRNEEKTSGKVLKSIPKQHLVANNLASLAAFRISVRLKIDETTHGGYLSQALNKEEANNNA